MFKYVPERYEEVKTSEFFLEEQKVIASISDGEEYYNHIIDNIELDKSNPNNSYIMFACGKVDELDKTKPCVFVEAESALPDIDIDFPPSYREKAIEYVTDKYGEENVAQVVTFSRLQGKSALKEVMRAEGEYTHGQMNEITENFPEESSISDQLANMDQPSILRWMLEDAPKLIQDYCYLDDDGELAGEYKEVFRKALLLEGTLKSQGKHAAGVIISSEPIRKYAAMIPSKDKRVCCFEMKPAEKAGLVKFDFLGVEIMEKIQQVLGSDLSHIPLDDEKVWELLAGGNVKGCFQLETQAKWTKELKPRSIEDISALSSIIRPGTIQAKHESGDNMTEYYCKVKNGKIKLDSDYFAHDILKDTYNCIIYQESILKICKEFAGFSGPKQIKMMKSVGKKDADLMLQLESEFLDGCKNTGKITEEQAKDIFEQIKKSARYLFNKSVTPDTLVQTTSGMKTIDEAEIGDYVNSPNGYVKILDKFENGDKEVFNVELESGHSIKCSIDHKFMCSDGSIRPLKDILLDKTLEICIDK